MPNCQAGAGCEVFERGPIEKRRAAGGSRGQRFEFRAEWSVGPTDLIEPSGTFFGWQGEQGFEQRAGKRGKVSRGAAFFAGSVFQRV